MLKVSFAFVVATALLLSFKATRWMGAIALFIVLTVAPVFSSVLLILVAIGCHLYYRKPKWQDSPQKLLRRD